jgi:subtilisin family serine protease
MPFALALILTFALVPGPPAVDAESSTVRLLVQGESVQGLSSTETSESNETGWHRIEVPLRGTAEETAAALAEETGAEVVVEQRYQLYAPQDEPRFGEQWHLENGGQSGGISDADVDAVTAWGSSLGSGVVIAVIDSGVNMTHVDLDGQIHPSRWDFVDNDNDPSPTGTGESEGHGTAVAGIIAAEANGTGITGIAPESRIMVIRSCEEGFCGGFDIAEGIHFAVNQGADIINLSLGSITETEDPALEDAIGYARSRDVLVVVAAGNEGEDLEQLPPGYQLIPGGIPLSNILTVGATDRWDNLAGFSNYGPSVVDIAAPGVDMLTTGVSSNTVNVVAQGTSFSSPLVAGIAALLLSENPGIGHQELIARIHGFVDRPAGISGATNSGRVNAGRTLTHRFVDTSSSVFVNAIDWLATAKITQGCNPPSNHRFCPGDRVSRGEMAVFLSRAFGLPATDNDYFTDDDGLFYEGAANRLRAAGLTVGCGSNRYCGESEIRRDEMAAMLARALSLPNSATDHFDDDEGSVFEAAINKIAEAGLTQGCNPPANDRFCPTNRVTRGEMSAFIKRSVELPG